MSGLRHRENRADRPLGMRRSELDVLAGLVREHPVRCVLEIGMAHGSSTLAMLGVLREKGGGQVTSIDPFQFEAPSGHGGAGFGGQGVTNVRAAGFEAMHRYIAEADYVALPGLVREGAVFDLVLIDGWHSFESTFVDYFYADRLLRIGGLCVFHDTAFPAVYKAVRYLMTNTSYALIGPRPEVMHASILPRVWRRARYLLSGQSAAFRDRRTRWCSLAAFQKTAAGSAPELAIAEF